MNRRIEDVFQFCPVCGESSQCSGANPFVCASCDYHHYFSPATAVGALITDADDKLLFIERAKDPGKGKLGLPGGFVDAGESAEEAARREIREEVGLTNVKLEYLMTHPNVYHFRGVTTQVLDLFFVGQVESLDNLQLDPEEASDYLFASPTEEVRQRMAFESNRLAVKRFAETRQIGDSFDSEP